jgi:hypothetical protein
MIKLNDTQLVILSGAARREDGLVDFGPNPIPASHRKLIAKLLSLGFVVEVTTGQGQPTWRTETSDKACQLKITGAGLTAIGIEAAEDDKSGAVPSDQSADTVASALHSPIHRAGSKLMTVVDLLRREEGVSLGEITSLTNWLPHSARAALTGLRKKGHHIERFTGATGASSYRIAALRDAALGSDFGGQL